MSEPLTTPELSLEYRKADRKVRPMSRSAAAWVAGLTAVPTVVGVSILLLYRLTALDGLPILGFLWLGVGGGLTFVLGIIAFVSAVRAAALMVGDAVVIRRYIYALIGCGVATGASFVCARLGIVWMDQPHVHVTAKNATTTPIDRLVIHLQGGDVDIGPLPPGGQSDAGTIWTYHHGGPLEITVTVNGRSRRKADRTNFVFQQKGVSSNVIPLDVVVEDAELPKVKP